LASTAYIILGGKFVGKGNGSDNLAVNLSCGIWKTAAASFSLFTFFDGGPVVISSFTGRMSSLLTITYYEGMILCM
jgi:hypothetical protein